MDNELEDDLMTTTTVRKDMKEKYAEMEGRARNIALRRLELIADGHVNGEPAVYVGPDFIPVFLSLGNGAYRSPRGINNGVSDNDTDRIVSFPIVAYYFDGNEGERKRIDIYLHQQEIDVHGREVGQPSRGDVYGAILEALATTKLKEANGNTTISATTSDH